MVLLQDVVTPENGMGAVIDNLTISPSGATAIELNPIGVGVLTVDHIGAIDRLR